MSHIKKNTAHGHVQKRTDLTKPLDNISELVEETLYWTIYRANIRSEIKLLKQETKINASEETIRKKSENLKQDSGKTNAEFIFLFQNIRYPFDPGNKSGTYNTFFPEKSP
ncbi:hypothetical protein [Methanosarcina siciliae]|uniref:hypothetical protein n=1 Tax=Methanosarcina siciliae TaxID=38027 RepID=UPI0012E09499|nr:hypothetical protein [Methanosarcina siciliae]